ncbi:MAG: glycosyltransferase [Deltaproteobacteria bacterium]|nr:glycosyltransferase [Deltaproteobacteria bacterium]
MIPGVAFLPSARWARTDRTDGAAGVVYFLLPAYNEEGRIGEQLRTIRELMEKRGAEYEVVVVDDGSVDGTFQEVHDHGGSMSITVLRHAVNGGVGLAFRHGFAAMMQVVRDQDVVVTMDADNTQSLQALEPMLRKIEEGCEVVVGSCLGPGGEMVGVPLRRRLLTYTCNRLYRLCFGIQGIHTYTGFYRAHSGRAIRLAAERYGQELVEAAGFEAMAEMLIKFHRLRLRMAEVPMILRYDRKGTPSKMRVWITIIEHLRVIARNLMRRR